MRLYCLYPVYDIPDAILSALPDFFRKLERLGRELGLYIQAVNSELVLGKRHVDTALLTAVKNYSYGTNISRSLPLEIIISLSGQRQIDKAIDLFGLTERTTSFFLFIAPKNDIDHLIEVFGTGEIGDHVGGFSEEESPALSEKIRKIANSVGLEGFGDRAGSSRAPEPLFRPDTDRVKEFANILEIPYWDCLSDEDNIAALELAVCEKINLFQY